MEKIGWDSGGEAIAFFDGVPFLLGHPFIFCSLFVGSKKYILKLKKKKEERDTAKIKSIIIILW